MTPAVTASITEDDITQISLGILIAVGLMIWFLVHLSIVDARERRKREEDRKKEEDEKTGT